MSKDQIATFNKEVTRKKKKIIDFKDLRKGGKFSDNEFIPRKSILDQFQLDSSISHSPFKGLLRCALLMCLVYMLNNVAVRIFFPSNSIQLRYVTEGKIISTNEFNHCLGQVKICVFQWALCHFFTYMYQTISFNSRLRSFGNQLLLVKGVPMWLVKFLEMLAQNFLFFYCPYYLYYKK